VAYREDTEYGQQLGKLSGKSGGQNEPEGMILTYQEKDKSKIVQG
jgi:hypothetical protein